MLTASHVIIVSHFDVAVMSIFCALLIAPTLCGLGLMAFDFVSELFKPTFTAPRIVLNVHTGNYQYRQYQVWHSETMQKVDNQVREWMTVEA